MKHNVYGVNFSTADVDKIIDVPSVDWRTALTGCRVLHISFLLNLIQS